MQPQLEDLIGWAKHAGSILMAGLHDEHNVMHKGATNLVTEMDHRSEQYILGQIKERFPAHKIVAEESGVLPGTTESCWYVDPLDGTTNYAHAMPIFSVSIAYAEGGDLKLGVVYDPSRDECFSAERGRGAWLNGRPIRVSQTEELIASLLVTGFPYEYEVARENLDYFGRFAARTQSLRRLGSAALDLCYVACGRLDGHWEIRLGPWDVAAGGLICQEAGGVVTGLRGEPDFLQPPNAVVAGNPVMQKKMLAVINGE